MKQILEVQMLSLAACLLTAACLLGQPLPVHAQVGGVTLMDAVSAAIERSYDVVLARETVHYKEGTARVEKGEQDIEITADVSYEDDEVPLGTYYQSAYGKETESTKTLTTTLEAEKEFQNGITLTSAMTLEREDDNLLGYPPDNTSVVYFEVSLPVLSLWTRGLMIGKERNSEIDLAASRKDLAATVSNSVKSVSDAFWEALARKKMLENYRAMETDAETFLSEMTQLSEKNEYPAAHLDSIQANLDAKVVGRISAEQSYFAALQSLALAMGTDEADLSGVTDVDGDFPEAQTLTQGAATLIDMARENRADLEADRIRVEYYRELLLDAREGLLPDLDLSLIGGYQGLEETYAGRGYVDALSENVSGPTYSIGLTYSMALGNNAAGGAYQEARSMLAQKELAFKNRLRTITSDVLVAVQNLRQNLAALKRQQDAATTYQSAMEKESVLFRLESVSLSDLLDARDDYYNSLNSLISKQQAYAQSLAQLHQTLGTLVEQEGEAFRIRQASLLSPTVPVITTE